MPGCGIVSFSARLESGTSTAVQRVGQVIWTLVPMSQRLAWPMRITLPTGPLGIRSKGSLPPGAGTGWRSAMLI